MAFYDLEWKSSAAKELRKLPKAALAKVLKAVEGLPSNPRPDGVRKLAETENTYRIRIGDYRVVYNIFDKRLVIEIIRVRDRKDAYK
jgi:mRNA interferase RelE/StbE